MTEVTKYIADDGTEFNDPDACIEYELKNRIDDLGADLEFYDDNKKPIVSGEPSDILAASYFITVKTKKAWDFLQDIGYEYSLSSPSDGRLQYNSGLYYYDEHGDKWLYWQDEFLKIMEIGRYFGQA